MSLPSVALNQACIQCSAALPAGALVCSSCHALVHATVLDQLAKAARQREDAKDLAGATSDWRAVLERIPPDSAQAEWVRGNIRRLDVLATSSRPEEGRRRGVGGKLGPFAPLVVLLAKGKFLLSLGPFVAFYWALYGVRFGIGFAILILIHEMGHFTEIRRRGLPADMPVFLPGLGAYVRWAGLGVSARTRAFVSLAGPLAGCMGAAVCVLLWTATGERFWAGLATLSAMLNVLNLIPLWVLDGGQAIAALNKPERIVLAAAAVIFAGLFAHPIFLLVAAGALWRAFSKDIPAEPNHAVTVCYLGALATLGLIIHLQPAAFPVGG
jgi:Zn-dependent protease